MPLSEVIAIIDAHDGQLPSETQAYLQRQRSEGRLIVVDPMRINSYVILADRAYGCPVAPATLKARGLVVGDSEWLEPVAEVGEQSRPQRATNGRLN